MTERKNKLWERRFPPSSSAFSSSLRISIVRLNFVQKRRTLNGRWRLIISGFWQTAFTYVLFHFSATHWTFQQFVSYEHFPRLQFLLLESYLMARNVAYTVTWDRYFGAWWRHLSAVRPNCDNWQCCPHMFRVINKFFLDTLGQFFSIWKLQAAMGVCFSPVS